MEFFGILAYKNLKYLFYLLMITIGVYFLNTIFVFYIDLGLVDHFSAPLETGKAPDVKVLQNLPLDGYKTIWERNLFAVTADEEAGSGSDDQTIQLDKLALTSLNCTLVGTIISEEGNSWAIIKDNQTNRQDRVTVGSTISGAKVVMILRNKVVLNRDGKDELLVMGIERIRADRAAGEGTEPGKPEGDVLTYKISKDFVQENINNVAQIMSNVRVKPHFDKGKPDGFEISRIKKGSMFQSMGFKDGDLIKTVNGHDIRSAEDIMKLYNTLKDSNLFSIEIFRDNKKKTLNFKVR